MSIERAPNRKHGRVKKRTLANPSKLPAGAIEALRRVLRGERPVNPADAFSCVRSLPHGHVAAVLGALRRRGLHTLPPLSADLQLRGGRPLPLGPARAQPLRASTMRKLPAGGTVTPALFDERDIAEVTSDEFPGERPIVCRNPLPAAERRRKRQELPAAAASLRRSTGTRSPSISSPRSPPTRSRSVGMTSRPRPKRNSTNSTSSAPTSSRNSSTRRRRCAPTSTWRRSSGPCAASRRLT